MGSTCTMINVGVPAPVCTGTTPCADGSPRECRDDEFYWDCVGGCWKKGESCHVDPCVNNPCGETCTDCTKCPGLPSCKKPPTPCELDPCGSTCAGYPNCLTCPDNPGCKVTPPEPYVPPTEPPYVPPAEPPVVPSQDPCEINPCLAVCPNALRSAYQCDAELPVVIPQEPQVTPPTGTEGNISEGSDMYKYILLIGGLALVGGMVLMSGRQ